MKLRTPIAIFSCFNVSPRKETLLYLPKISSQHFFYCATSMWNKFLSCPEGLAAKSFSAEIGSLKLKVKELILRRQTMGDPNEWHDDINFVLNQ